MICLESYVRPGFMADIVRFDELVFLLVSSETGTLPQESELHALAVAAFGECSVPTMLADLGQHGLGCADVLYAARLYETDALAPRVWGE